MLDHTEVERYLALLAARQDLRELLQLDHYILGERLGEGGFSWVYKLINPGTGQGDLAFKIVSADTCKHANRSAFSNPRMLNTLRRELWLGHELALRPREHLVRFYGAEESVDGYQQPVFLYVMDCYKFSFRDFMEASYSFQEETALRLGIQICQALTALHTMDVIHRDVKAENIYIVPTEHGPKYVLGDFGNCRFLDEENMGSNTRIVSPGTSPQEQGSSSGRPEANWDTYALGATLYRYCNAGVPLETGAAGYRPPRNGSCALQQILAKAVSRRPEDRYQSARQMLYDLSRLAREQRSAVSGAAPRNTRPLLQQKPALDRTEPLSRQTKPLPRQAAEKTKEKQVQLPEAKKALPQRRRQRKPRRKAWFLLPAAALLLTAFFIHAPAGEWVSRQVDRIQAMTSGSGEDGDVAATMTASAYNLAYANSSGQFFPYGMVGYFATPQGLFQGSIHRVGGFQDGNYTEQSLLTDFVQINDDPALYINQVGEYLYYLGGMDGGDSVIRSMDLTNHRTRTVFRREGSIANLQATTGGLYFSVAGEGLYRVDLKGKAEDLLAAGNILSFFVLDNQLYYVACDEQFHPLELRQKDLSGGSEMVLYRLPAAEDGEGSSSALRFLCSDGDALYFEDFQQGVFRLDGSPELLPGIPAGITRLWALEDSLFYTATVSRGEILCRYDLEQQTLAWTLDLPSDLGGYFGIYPNTWYVVLCTTSGWYQLDPVAGEVLSLPLPAWSLVQQNVEVAEEYALEIREVTYDPAELTAGTQADLTVTVAYDCPQDVSCQLRVGINEDDGESYNIRAEQTVSASGECTFTIPVIPTLYEDGTVLQLYLSLLAEEGEEDGRTLATQTYALPVARLTEGIAVPQVVGYPQSQAVEELEALGLDFQVWWYEGDCEGEGDYLVAGQSIPAGTLVKPGAVVKLQLKDE